MIKHIQDFIRKTLTSRKFWAAVAASVPFAQMADWNSFAMVWMAYAGIQGAVDASEGLGSKRALEVLTQPPREPDAPVPRLSSGELESLRDVEGGEG